MPRKKAHVSEGSLDTVSDKQRTTVYDVVAGRVGINGFLSENDRAFSTKALAPEDVLARRTGSSEDDLYQAYNAEDYLPLDQHLPSSDLIKAIHTYTSDFYSKATPSRGQVDFESMDGTALLAMGILLEEAARELLGENGDMVLVEPRGLETQLPESKLSMYQVEGMVQPPPTPPPVDASIDSGSEENPPKKKRVRRV